MEIERERAVDCIHSYTTHFFYEELKEFILTRHAVMFHTIKHTIKPTTPEPDAAENISMRYSKLFYTLYSKQRPKSLPLNSSTRVFLH